MKVNVYDQENIQKGRMMLLNIAEDLKEDCKMTVSPIKEDGKKEDDVSFYFFDTENYVPIAVQKEIKSGQGKGLVSNTTFSDYQEVDGIYFPFSMTQGLKDKPGQPISISSITLNPEIDDNTFMFPKEDATATETPATEDKK